MRGILHRFLSSASATALALAPVATRANPLGGQIRAGSVSISGAGSPTLTIDQSSQRAVIDWRSFNIAPGETTRFAQPDASSVTLNRVTGNLGASQIDGTIRANGGVYIVNPDGILFGRSAKVNVGSLLGTTHDIANSDFMAGRNNFTIPGNPAASIVNQGRITAASGGFAALVAPGVRNDGVITANLGTVSLSSNNGFTLDLYGDNLIKLQPGDSIAGEVRDAATGQTLRSLVQNTGRLRARGGRVLLSAVGARKVLDSVINTSGVIEADTVGKKNGMVVFGAATGGGKPTGAPAQIVKVSGRIRAAGRKAGTRGGKIQITGEQLVLTKARLNASGRAGGGTILVGGDFMGGNPKAPAVTQYGQAFDARTIPTATTVGIDAQSVLDASAKATGNGGKIVVWSDINTQFYGSLVATGGSRNGNGGFGEVSSRGQLVAAGSVHVGAGNGRTGTVLFDPDAAEVVGALPGCATASPPNCGTTSYILASDLAGGGGVSATSSIGVEAAVNSVGYVALSAPLINVNAPISALGVSIYNATNVVLNAKISGTYLDWQQSTPFTLHSDNPKINFTSWNISGDAVLAPASTALTSVTANNVTLNLSTIQNLKITAGGTVTSTSTGPLTVNDNGALTVLSAGPVSLGSIGQINVGANASAYLSTNAGFAGLNIGSLGSGSRLSIAAATSISGIGTVDAVRDAASTVQLNAPVTAGTVVGAGLSPAPGVNIALDRPLSLPALTVTSAGTVTFAAGQPLNVPGSGKWSISSTGPMSLSGVSQVNLGDNATAAIVSSAAVSGVSIGALGASSLLSIGARGTISDIGTVAALRDPSSQVILNVSDNPPSMPVRSIGPFYLTNAAALPPLAGADIALSKPLDLPFLNVFSQGTVTLSSGTSLKVPANSFWAINSVGPMSLAGVAQLDIGDHATAGFRTAADFTGLNIGALGAGSTLAVVAGTTLSGVATATAARDLSSQILLAAAEPSLVLPTKVTDPPLDPNLLFTGGQALTGLSITLDHPLELPSLTAVSQGTLSASGGFALSAPDHAAWRIASLGSLSLDGLSQLNLGDHANVDLQTKADLSGLRIGGLASGSNLVALAGTALSGVATVTATRDISSQVTLGALSTQGLSDPRFNPLSGLSSLGLPAGSQTVILDHQLDVPKLTVFSAGTVTAGNLAALAVPDNGVWKISSNGAIALDALSQLNVGAHASATLVTAVDFNGLNIGSLGVGSALTVTAATSLSGVGTTNGSRDPTSLVSLGLLPGYSLTPVRDTGNLGAPAAYGTQAPQPGVLLLDRSLELPALYVFSAGSLKVSTDLAVPNAAIWGLNSEGPLSVAAQSQVNLGAGTQASFTTAADATGFQIGNLGAISALKIIAGTTISGLTTAGTVVDPTASVSLTAQPSPFLPAPPGQAAAQGVAITIDRSLALPVFAASSAGDLTVSAAVIADTLDLRASRNIVINADLRRADAHLPMLFAISGGSVAIGGSARIGAEPGTSDYHADMLSFTGVTSSGFGQSTANGPITVASGATLSADRLSLAGGAAQIDGALRFGNLAGTFDSLTMGGSLTMVPVQPSAANGPVVQSLRLSATNALNVGTVNYPGTAVPQHSEFSGGNVTFGGPLAVNGETFITSQGEVRFKGDVTLGAPRPATDPIAGAGVPYPLLVAIAGSFTGDNITLDGTLLADGTKSGTVSLFQRLPLGGDAAGLAYGNRPESSSFAAASASKAHTGSVIDSSSIGTLTTQALAANGINVGYDRIAPSSENTLPKRLPSQPITVPQVGIAEVMLPTLSQPPTTTPASITTPSPQDQVAASVDAPNGIGSMPSAAPNQLDSSATQAPLKNGYYKSALDSSPMLPDKILPEGVNLYTPDVQLWEERQRQIAITARDADLWAAAAILVKNNDDKLDDAYSNSLLYRLVYGEKGSDFVSGVQDISKILQSLQDGYKIDGLRGIDDRMGLVRDFILTTLIDKAVGVPIGTAALVAVDDVFIYSKTRFAVFMNHKLHASKR